MRTPDVQGLVRGVLARERAAVARAISLVEDARPECERAQVELMGELRAATTHAVHRVGLTGPPGVGKSTLAAGLVRALRAQGRTVGVVAVDPSSLRSGGAVLGDRARMALDPDDRGVFFRSLASKGQSGGLVDAALSVVGVLSAAYDVVLIETTGVGQTETDVRDVADTVVLVIQPGSGDTLQFIKAGIMEIPDVLVVNKADEERLAKQAEADVRQALAAEGRAGVGGPAPGVLAVSALHRRGIDALVAALDAHRASFSDEGLLELRRRGAAAWLVRSVRRRRGEAGLEALGGEVMLRERLQRELGVTGSPEALLAALLHP